MLITTLLIMDKKIKKKTDKKCCFCPENNYTFLDLHRIEWGGPYSESNTLTCCVKCHRKIHQNIIKIIGKNFCTNGKYLVHFIENNEEKFAEI
jgi:hypothetical protein